jgi:hypothetical protein
VAIQDEIRNMRTFVRKSSLVSDAPKVFRFLLKTVRKHEIEIKELKRKLKVL